MLPYSSGRHTTDTPVLKLLFLFFIDSSSPGPVTADVQGREGESSREEHCFMWLYQSFLNSRWVPLICHLQRPSHQNVEVVLEEGFR